MVPQPALQAGGRRGINLELVFPVAVMLVLVVLVIPLPPIVLDMLLTLNLGVVILLMLVTLNVKQALELSVFPSVLLLLTLARLSLNVATTRQILLKADAGSIIDTFGNFVVGGSLPVGMVVFLILIIIQFVVITKGSTRISEVAARFVLDAMPGKQMAIDADLNAGLIQETEAKDRRQHLMQEAEFYGAMDGAGKFVRGDAIAGLIITAINLIGGIIIGMMNDMSIMEAVEKYSILTIGDGLISQIPALIIAVSSGILVTKQSSDSSIGPEIGNQFLANKNPLIVGAGILAVLPLVLQGLPALPFWVLAIVLFMASRKTIAPMLRPEDGGEEPALAEPKSPLQEHLDDFLETDRACIEIGAQLIPLVNPKRGLTLLQRIGTLRRDLARRSGLWVPLVRVRDNASLSPEEYHILVGGQEVAKGRLHMDSLLAIHPDGSQIQLDGEETRDPAFGLPAKWITEADRSQAEMAGCTVVDPPSVMITHLREVMRRHAGELLSREDLKQLVDKVKETSASVVEELIPNTITMGGLHRILTLLLEERVPITNMTRIMESLANNAGQVKDPEDLSERVRADLSRAICEPFLDVQGRIHGIMFDPMLELEFRKVLRDKQVAIEPEQLEKLIVKLATITREATNKKQEVALLVDASLRRAIRKMLSRSLPDLAVIAYTEVPNDVMLEPAAIIRPEEVLGQRPAGMEAATV